LEWKSKSPWVKVQDSCQMSSLKRDLWWPSRTSISISTTISSLIFSGVGCTAFPEETKPEMVIGIQIGFLNDDHALFKFKYSFEKKPELWLFRILFWIPMMILFNRFNFANFLGVYQILLIKLPPLADFPWYFKMFKFTSNSTAISHLEWCWVFTCENNFRHGISVGSPWKFVLAKGQSCALRGPRGMRTVSPRR